MASKLVMPKFPNWINRAGKSARLCFQVFKSRSGWRWRMWARNGRLIAESGESYEKRVTVDRMVRVVRGDRDIPIWLP